MRHALTARLDGFVTATVHFATPRPGQVSDDNVIFTETGNVFVGMYKNRELTFAENLPEIFTSEYIEILKKACTEFVGELNETGLM